MYFRNYELRKSWLHKCLISTISEDHFRGNVVDGPKHCFNLNKSTFTIFIDHCESN